MAVPKYAIYQLTSMYMKGIQAGIQGGHAANELAAKHIDGDLTKEQMKIYEHWLIEDKVVKVKNAGNATNILNLIQLFVNQDKYPYDSFSEPELNNAITSLAVVLPCYITGEEIMNERDPAVRLLLTTVNELRSAS